ncbi:peptidase S8/S53 domain-containing protein [Trichoderma chlorosporum]
MMAESKAPADATSITVNGRVVEPHEHYARDAKGTDHIVLTLYDSITPGQHAELEELHVHFQEDLGNFTYLCRYEPSDLKPLRHPDWVRQVDVYRNKFKIPEELSDYVNMIENSSLNNDIDEILINVMPHHESSDAAGLQKLAASVAATIGVDLNDVKILTGKVQVEVKAALVEEIARDKLARVIEQVMIPCLADDQANKIALGPVQSLDIQSFRGDNQTIAVIDTGFDLGTPSNCHPAFHGRIKGLISLGRSEDALPTDAQRYDDPNGHGTHVCGTIVGQPIETSEGTIGGAAPNAKLVITSIIKTKKDEKEKSYPLAPIEDVYKAFEIPYHEHKARIFSNSWGDDLGLKGQRPYGVDAQSIDAFVRDHPDALIIFSAGNNNPDIYPSSTQRNVSPKATIGSQAAAKNCLTVGASGSTRAGIDKPSGLTALDPDRVYPKSSRGPTNEARTKPDVVAPGFSIFSAQSRHPGLKYSGSRVVNKESSGEVAWQTRSGTSHATPLAAGCAAILREIAQTKGMESPPAALLKALLINGADKLLGVDIEAQGFGRINLSASAEMLQQPPILACDGDMGGLQATLSHGTLIGNALKHNDVFELTLVPEAQGHPEDLDFRITLVYNDKPGLEAQNNLNLTVIDTVTGAAINGYVSEDNMKVQNNVEQVVLESASSNPLKIRIVAQKIFPGESQDFVLAWALLKPYTGLQKA